MKMRNKKTLGRHHRRIDLKQVDASLRQIKSTLGGVKEGRPKNEIAGRQSDRRSIHIDCAVEAESMPVKILRGIMRAKVEELLPPHALAVAKEAEQSERQHLRNMAEFLEGTRP